MFFSVTIFTVPFETICQMNWLSFSGFPQSSTTNVKFESNKLQLIKSVLLFKFLPLPLK